jgi:hypothetical protein
VPEYPHTSDSSDLPATPPDSVTGDESSQISLPSVFDRGPGFESLTAAAWRGAALGYPFLRVVNDVAGMALSPVSILVTWNYSYDRAKVSVQFSDPDDVDTVAEFYELAADLGTEAACVLQDVVDDDHGDFDLQVFGPVRS